MKSFLEQNLGSKKKKVVLGVQEDKLGSAIQEGLSVTCQRTGVVQVGAGIFLYSLLILYRTCSEEFVPTLPGSSKS